MTHFIDTAVIMYAAGKEHPLRAPSQRVLRRVSTGDLAAITSAEVVQEILHRFSGGPNRETGALMAENTLALLGPVLSVTDRIMRRLPELVRRYPALTARDLLHVATCVDAQIETIVSPDRGFDAVTEIRRIGPGSA